MLVVLFLGLIISSTVAVPLVPFMSENDNPNEFSDYGKNILCYFVITRFENVFSFFFTKDNGVQARLNPCILSGWLEINHAPCIINCFLNGYSGGWCDDGKCNCREQRLV